MRLKFSCQQFRPVVFVIPLFLGTLQASAGHPATAITLTMTSGGNGIASGGSVASGSKLTLTVAVLSGSTKVTSGQVNFCDATAASCTDIHLLGTAQLTSAGTATLNLRPAIGSHSYNAVFAGTPSGATPYAPSTSSSVTLQVAGLYPSFAVLAYTGVAPSAYDLSTVVGGNASTAPTGTVSYVDVNNSAVLGAASLSALPSGPTFLNADWPVLSWFTLGGKDLAEPIAVGDFNGDGIPDIAGAGGAGTNAGLSWDAAAGAALGDGTGTLFPAATSDLGSSLETFGVAVSDFNGDGKLDLAVGGYSGKTYSINILLGNGDGTFTNKGSVATGGAFQVFAVGDFNGDGIPDLAVANTTADIVTILLGNGDGSFTASTAANSPTGANPSAIAVADFNGDGIPDLAIGNSPPGGGAGSLTILLGNGNGTFTAADSPVTNSGVNSIAIADFNGDGFADIVAADGLTITMLTGKGNGTFSTSTIQPIGGPKSLGAIIVGDFNGDGHADVAINGWSFLLLGNGDGTFSQLPFEVVLPTSVGSATFEIAVGADFNGDGTTDLAGPAADDGAVQAIGTVLLAANQTATATANGVTLPPGTNSQEVDGSYAGDSNYLPATSGSADLYAPSQASATVSLTASPSPAPFGSSVTLTATVSGSAGTPAGTVGFYDDNSLLGSAALNSSGVATYATSALPLGANSLTASYGGNSIYLVANSATVNLTVTPALLAATITATPSAKSITAGQSLTVSVAVNGAAGAATPSGAVTLAGGSYNAQQTLASGAASFAIAAGALNSGADTLTATYSGDGNYAMAMTTATVTVSPVGMAIPAPAPVAPGASATATATLTASDNYTGTLNLTCSLTSSPAGAQSLPTCSLNPTSVTLKPGASGSSTLTVATTAASTSALLDPSHKTLWGFGGGSAALAALLMWGIPSKRRWSMSMLVLLSIVAASLAIGCGGGGPSTTGPGTLATTAGNYVFTVTGTDSAQAAIATSTTVTVTVQ